MARWSVPRIFVYGTLRRGQPHHDLLATARYLGLDRTWPAFTMFDLGSFPAVAIDGVTAIVGELYAVDAETLAAIDHLEGNPHWYRRTPLTLASRRRAQLYLMPRDLIVGTIIPSGDWLHR